MVQSPDIVYQFRELRLRELVPTPIQGSHDGLRQCPPVLLEMLEWYLRSTGQFAWPRFDTAALLAVACVAPGRDSPGREACRAAVPSRPCLPDAGARPHRE